MNLEFDDGRCFFFVFVDKYFALFYQSCVLSMFKRTVSLEMVSFTSDKFRKLSLRAQTSLGTPLLINQRRNQRFTDEIYLGDQFRAIFAQLQTSVRQRIKIVTIYTYINSRL